MSRARRSVAMALVAMATMASVGAATVPAQAASSTYASKHAKAVAAVQLFEENGFANLGLPKKHAVKVRACFRGVCAHDRLRADPVCDPETSVCLGTALRAVKVTRHLTVTAFYA